MELKDEVVEMDGGYYYGYFDKDTKKAHGYGFYVKDGSIYEGFF